MTLLDCLYQKWDEWPAKYIAAPALRMHVKPRIDSVMIVCLLYASKDIETICNVSLRSIKSALNPLSCTPLTEYVRDGSNGGSEDQSSDNANDEAKQKTKSKSPNFRHIMPPCFQPRLALPWRILDP